MMKLWKRHQRKMKVTVRIKLCRKRNAAGIVIFLFLFLTACTDKNMTQKTIVEQTDEQNIWDDSVLVKNNAPNEELVGMLPKPVANGAKNTYDTLNVATYITKVDDTYFIADCYHDQILYNKNLTDPVSQWCVLTDEVHYAHTIASDGVMFLVDDTENNRLLAFQRTDEGYVHTQTLENIEIGRAHV